MAILHVAHPKSHFSVFSNDLIRNDDLSFQARGILMFYLSNASGTPVSNEYLERRSKRNGRESIRSAVNELIAAGYYRREYKRMDDREECRWGTIITVTPVPWEFDDQPTGETAQHAAADFGPDDDEAAPNVTQEAASSQVGSGYGFPSGRNQPGCNQSGREPSPKSRRNSEKNLSNEPAPAGNKTDKPGRTRRPLRSVTAEESPMEGGRTVGMSSPPTPAVRRRRDAAVHASTGGMLAREFGEMAAARNLGGPQQVEGKALARNLTSWMHAEQNADTPETIRRMMRAFFDDPGGNPEYPLWRRFLSEGPKLRGQGSTDNGVIDYANAQERDMEWAREHAAAGDERARRVLTGEDKPWMRGR